MFGEYGLYLDDKMVGVICDDRLFIKPTATGRDFAGPLEEAPAYPGAKASLVVDDARLADGDWLSTLISVTAKALPAPKKKRPKLRD